MLEPSILWENETVIVLNKPAGWVVNRARSVKQITLQDWIEEYFQDDALWQAERARDETFAERSGMVHRLDKDTSGVIIFAKRVSTMFDLMRQFKERTVEKTYISLVHGALPTPEGIVKAAIKRHPQNREKFSVASDGRPSETHFAVQQFFSGIKKDELHERNRAAAEQVVRNLEKELKIYEDGFSLLRLTPKTGRTHQIRVHMQFLHHPLVGDERYVGRRRARLDALWCPRQFLHAETVAFHLENGEEQRVEAPLAADLQASLDFLIAG